MVVEVYVTVPDDTDISLLHLNNGLEDFRVEAAGVAVEGSKVTGYCTADVYDNVPGYP